MNANEIVEVVSGMGKILLENGAEAYRVEETMVKVCKSFHAEDAQAFVITTGIMLSITIDQKVYTKVIRVASRGVNLHKIHEINDLSRTIVANGYSIDEVKEKMQAIDEQERYSQPVTLFFSACSALGFAFFFQGSYQDAICAFITGFIIKFVALYIERLQINAFIQHVCSAFVGATCALILHTLHFSSNKDIVMISGIMLLVPGLAITNAIRDTIAQDYLAGVTRAAEACFIAVGVAVGIVSAITIYTNLGGI